MDAALKGRIKIKRPGDTFERAAFHAKISLSDSLLPARCSRFYLPLLSP